MERELPPYRAAVTKPARPSIWPTLIVGAVLATVIGGGVYLLGQTRARWEQNRQDKAARAAQFEREWAAGQAYREESPAEEARRQQMVDKLRHDRRQQSVPDGLRCINGQLFRRLPNGWENVPGSHC